MLIADTQCIGYLYFIYLEDLRYKKAPVGKRERALL